MNSTLSKFLARATQKSVPDSAASVLAPQEKSVESVKVEELSTPAVADVHKEESPQTTPVKPPVSALAKVLAAPKPAPITTIPSKSKIDEMMQADSPLDQISMITDESQLIDPAQEKNRFLFELNLLDQKITEDNDIDMFNIDSIRGIISRIMIDWKANPDYDQLVKGEHVKKIMKFMYQTQTRAIEANNVKAEKAVKGKTRKAKQSAISFELDLEDF